ncbi:MAG: hypothetical protein GY943_35950 [Chloroflexi bacterium]|nr:hypothetical protein [Chloroflexota bacterium]
MPNTGATYTPRWEFVNNVLQPWGYLYASTISYVPYIRSSVVTTATLELPFGSDEQKQEDSQMIVVDVEAPSVGMLTPINGELIGGDLSYYVMGGYSNDPTTWSGCDWSTRSRWRCSDRWRQRRVRLPSPLGKPRR